jgi:hypothetical protein
MGYGTLYTSESTRLVPEESKVEPKRVCLFVWLPKKKSARQVALFCHVVFKEQAPPQSGEDPLLRWFWSFHRREWNRGSLDRHCPRRGVASRLVFAWLHHLPQHETNRKFNYAL